MELTCKNFCKHQHCPYLCKKCKQEVMNNFGKDISTSICKHLDDALIIQTMKIQVPESEYFELHPLVDVGSKNHEKYDFFLCGTNDAIIGFKAALWEANPELFTGREALLPNYPLTLRSISLYELEDNYEELFEIKEKLFERKVQIESFQHDGYITTWFVDEPRDFAAGYFLGWLLDIFDKSHPGIGLYYLDLDSAGKNLYYPDSDNIIIPNYNALDLCIHRH